MRLLWRSVQEPPARLDWLDHQHRLRKLLRDDEIAGNIFIELDLDGDGYISEADIYRHLKSNGFTLPPHWIAKIRKDISEKDKFTLDEFMAMVERRNALLEKLFGAGDNNRQLSLKQVQEGLHTLGLDMEEHHLKQLFSGFKSNVDGRISLSEFREKWLLLPPFIAKCCFAAWATPDDHEPGHPQATALILPPKTYFMAGPTLLAGGIAGAVSRTVTAPLDRLKMLLQAGHRDHKMSIQRLLRGLAGEGLAVFKGNGANVMKIAPETAFKFYTYEQTKLWICKDSNNPTIAERLMCGGLAGFVAQTLVYPMEISKTRLAIAPSGMYTGVMDCLFKTWFSDGYRGWFKGLSPSLLGVIPYAGVDLTVFNTLKYHYIQNFVELGEEPGVVPLLACGAVSSMTGQAVAYPFAAVRTKMQAVGMAGYHGPHYKSVGDCLYKTVQRYGIRGLYKGIGVNFLKAVPAISISYAIYEKVKYGLLHLNGGEIDSRR